MAVKFGSNLPEKLGPEGVMESGSDISYTKTLEEQTLVYLSISPLNLSMMLVCNNLFDPHLLAFLDFARFSQTPTLTVRIFPLINLSSSVHDYYMFHVFKLT